ncbi:hypothetical protein [Sphingobacterium sp. IITKGP-BTPF85]|uniref:hypothetical protein n=1 Tax=Sphingobacterium sp. IITKGP-BTPF85 TaxID=1338009 RepID=UPI00038A47F7|nr:hypothetical protein [Sphingobacterium sp. IITKGP-BTPF85]KKX47445.1 hypothetical protein L950_0226395 [Sphingobacterium sp. IITKGP-BTPF85]
MKNTLNLLEKVISFLLENKIKHNHTKFSSGIVILDVWYNEKFYVFHFESNHIGISEVDNNVAFAFKMIINLSQFTMYVSLNPIH